MRGLFKAGEGGEFDPRVVFQVVLGLDRISSYVNHEVDGLFLVAYSIHLSYMGLPDTGTSMYSLHLGGKKF